MDENQITHPDQSVATHPADGRPLSGQLYTETLRTPTARWWKPVVGIVGGSVLLLVVSFIVGLLGMLVDAFAFGRDIGGIGMTPALFAASLIGLLVLIPITWVLVRFLHGQPWGYTFSVDGRLRGRWMARVVPVLLVVFVVYMLGFMQLGPDMGQRSSDWVAYAVMAVLLMPFQAAAEEIFFRGYVQRAAGSWFGNGTVSFVVGTAVSASLFAAFHFAADPWLIVYYLAFGVTLSIAARLTGGLEVAILLHAVNNVVSGVLGAYMSDMDRAFDRSAGVGGPFMLVQVVFVALVVAALVWWARRSGLRFRATT